MPEVTSPQTEPTRIRETAMSPAAYGAHSGTDVWRATHSPEWSATNAPLSGRSKAVERPNADRAFGADHDGPQMVGRPLMRLSSYATGTQ